MHQSWPAIMSVAATLLLAFSGASTIRKDRAEQIMYGAQKVNAHNTSYACEGAAMNITCPDQHLIRVLRANFGRFSLSLCSSDDMEPWTDTQCSNPQSTSIVKERCSRRQACFLWATEDMFGPTRCKDGTLAKKYLEVQFMCDPGAATLKPENANLQQATPYSHFATDKTESVILDYSTRQIMCPETIIEGAQFEQTQGPQLVQGRCPRNDAYAFVQCFRNGTWATNVDFTRCSKSPVAFDLHSYSEKQIQYMQNEVDYLKDQPKISGEEMLQRVERLENASLYFRPNVSHRLSWIKVLVDYVNTLTGPNRPLYAWADLLDRKKTKAARALMVAVENGARYLALAANTTETFPKSANLFVEVGVESAIDYLQVPSTSVYDSSVDSVRLPREALEDGKGASEKTKIIYMSFSNFDSFLPATIDNDNLIAGDSGSPMRKIASKIIGVTLPDAEQPIRNLNRFVQITFALVKRENLSNPTCVFWRDEPGSWSRQGCKLTSRNASHVTCACNHLTLFAVLMDVRGLATQMPDQHRLPLTMITCVGCVVSSVALALTFLALSMFKSYDENSLSAHRSDLNAITKNLCFCLLLAEVTFLWGIAEVEHRVLCGAIAACLHYLFLAAFSWMLLEGFHLYVLFVEVFRKQRSVPLRKYYYMLGYGMPFIIVAISVAIDRGSYGTKDYCWLNAENYFVFSFIGPVIVILTANFIFLFIALITICRYDLCNTAANCKAGSVPSSKTDTYSLLLKSAFGKIFVMGFTWTFGLLYISQDTIIAAYVFTVLNSFQGVFIFVFHVLLSDSMQTSYRCWVRRSDWLPEWFRSANLATSYDEPSSRSVEKAVPPLSNHKALFMDYCSSGNDQSSSSQYCDSALRYCIDQKNSMAPSSTKNWPSLLKCFSSTAATPTTPSSSASGSTCATSTTRRALLLDRTNSLLSHADAFTPKPMFAYRIESPFSNCEPERIVHCCQQNLTTLQPYAAHPAQACFYDHFTTPPLPGTDQSPKRPLPNFPPPPVPTLQQCQLYTLQHGDAGNYYCRCKPVVYCQSATSQRCSSLDGQRLASTNRRRERRSSSCADWSPSKDDNSATSEYCSRMTQTEEASALLDKKSIAEQSYEVPSPHKDHSMC